MECSELYDFLSDPQLLELQEQARVADDALDIFRLTENQHSSILAWCLTPSEGHGQGDAVLKDLLQTLHASADGVVYDNKKFVAKWTPGRIQTTSFGSAFVTREFGIVVDEVSKGRLDLFIVDPRNEFVIVVENKAGAKLTSEQLEKYQAAVKGQLCSRPVFREYDFAFVVLDRGLANYDDEYLDNLGNRWVLGPVRIFVCGA